MGHVLVRWTETGCLASVCRAGVEVGREGAGRHCAGLAGVGGSDTWHPLDRCLWGAFVLALLAWGEGQHQEAAVGFVLRDALLLALSMSRGVSASETQDGNQMELSGIGFCSEGHPLVSTSEAGPACRGNVSCPGERKETVDLGP